MTKQVFEQLNCVQMKLSVFDYNTWNYLTVCKQMSSGSFKNNVTYKLFRLQVIHIIDIYKQHLALNNLQGLICRETQLNQTM